MRQRPKRRTGEWKLAPAGSEDMSEECRAGIATSFTASAASESAKGPPASSDCGNYSQSRLQRRGVKLPLLLDQIGL